MSATLLDLFSGIGAFSLGLERAGMTPIAFCEIDPYCRDVLARHWPEVPIHDDVRTAEFPAADYICGGFPCQDVSRAGKRAGVTGARSGLYRELVRAIRMVRPRAAIVENVAALLDDGMGDVLGDLAEVGGGGWIEWDCVPSSAIGAPHQRDRVWIVAHRTPNANEWIGQDGWSQCVRRRGEGEGEGEGTGLDAISESKPTDPESIGRGPGRPGRPPDSFAWVRDATRWHAGHAYRAGLAERKSERGNARSELAAAERAARADVWQSRWPDEPALLGLDDGCPDRLERTKALGNSLVPQIPELIGGALLEAAGAVDAAWRA